MAEFNLLKEWARMVKASEDGGCIIPCSECPLLGSTQDYDCIDWARAHPEEAEAIIRKWAEEHPRKTRQSEFLKLFPKARVLDNGALSICPIDIDVTADCSNDCLHCHKRYWLEEIE